MMRTLVIAALVTSSLAAQSPGTGAFLVLYQPKPGMDRDFELGDQRHLDWHHANHDPSLWPGWTIATGERQGFFLDGTFFRPWTDFDHPFKQGEDVANWSVNVAPYADVRSVMSYDAVPALSTLTPDHLSAPLMLFSYVTVRPGASAEFESAIAAPLRNAPAPHMVLRPISGASDYLIMLGADKEADLPGDAAVLAAVAKAAAPQVERVRTETLRYRPELSYVPR